MTLKKKKPGRISSRHGDASVFRTLVPTGTCCVTAVDVTDDTQVIVPDTAAAIDQHGLCQRHFSTSVFLPSLSPFACSIPICS